jgi:hypothetical protein
MSEKEIHKQIIEAVKANNNVTAENKEPVLVSYESLRGWLPELKQEEINDAILQMNSVKIIDAITGDLQFFPEFF